MADSVKPLKINIDGVTSEIESSDVIAAVNIMKTAVGAKNNIPITNSLGMQNIMSDDISDLLHKLLQEQKMTNLYLSLIYGSKIDYRDIE
jgi:hypothetical protein